MAKGKQSSPSKKKRYVLQPGVTKQNKMRHIEQEKKRVERNSTKVRNKVKGSHRITLRSLNIAHPKVTETVGEVFVSDGYAKVSTSGYAPNRPKVVSDIYKFIV